MEINKNNVFYRHRMEISLLSRERNVDMGVATDMWAKSNCVTDAGAKNEWQAIMTYYQRHKTLTLADLLK